MQNSLLPSVAVISLSYADAAEHPNGAATVAAPESEGSIAMTVIEECAFELRFVPLRDDAAACAFPCDHQGRVQLDALSERARTDYLFARAVVGFHYARPVVAAR